jgi:hypothetical protein
LIVSLGLCGATFASEGCGAKDNADVKRSGPAALITQPSRLRDAVQNKASTPVKPPTIEDKLWVEQSLEASRLKDALEDSAKPKGNTSTRRSLQKKRAAERSKSD